MLSRTYNRKTGRTGLEIITGDTPDISEWIDFAFFDHVWFWDSSGDEDNPKLGRWLGVSRRVGSAMCYFVIKENGQVESRTSVQHVTAYDMAQPGINEQVERFDAALRERLDDKNHIQSDSVSFLYEEDLDELDEGIDQPTPMDPTALVGDIEEDKPETFDNYVGAELILDTGLEGDPIRGQVVKRARGEDGRPIGTAHGNPYLDT